MKDKLEIFVEKDGWDNDIVFQQQDDELMLVIVGEQFNLTYEQVKSITDFLVYHYEKRRTED